MTGKTFVKITNKDIYDQVVGISKALYKLNGKVLWHTWAIGVLLLLIIGAYAIVAIPIRLP